MGSRSWLRGQPLRGVGAVGPRADTDAQVYLAPGGGAQGGNLYPSAMPSTEPGPYSATRVARHAAGRPRSARPSLKARTPLSVSRGALRVPEITVYFWVIKGLSTALGESTSAYLVHKIHPVPPVGLGFTRFLFPLALQFSMRRYMAW